MDPSSNDQPKFGKIRSILFPIYINEFRKFIPLAIIFLCISFCYASVRMMKDTLLQCNADTATIYVIKTFIVLPMMILYTIIYSLIARKVSRDTRFNIVAIYFISFFLLSYFILIPHLDKLKWDSLANYLDSIAPAFKGYWSVIRCWHLALFYFNAEAWGTLMLSVAFWTFANEITSSKQAKRFYGFLSLGAAGGTAVAGLFFENQSLELIDKLGIVCAIMIIMFISYNLMALDIRKNPELYQVEIKPKKVKKKLSLGESFKYLAKSKYLILIALIVLGYNCFISLYESNWKGTVQELANTIVASGQDKSKFYALIYGKQSLISGILQFLFVVFVSSLVSNKSWKAAALFTPVLALIGVSLYTAFIYFQKSFSAILPTGHTALYYGVMVGLAVVCSIKAAKYVFFDTTKERAFIPLDEESKITGKAAIDSIGSRLGKSFGAFTVSILTPIFGGMTGIRGITTGLVFIVIFIWILSVVSLSGLYEEKLSEQEAEKAEKNV